MGKTIAGKIGSLVVLLGELICRLEGASESRAVVRGGDVSVPLPPQAFLLVFLNTLCKTVQAW
jgi:hypothetical protein